MWNRPGDQICLDGGCATVETVIRWESGNTTVGENGSKADVLLGTLGGSKGLFLIQSFASIAAAVLVIARVANILP